MLDQRSDHPGEERRPPRVFEWVVSRLLPQEYRETVLGDFAEDYSRRITRAGPFTANLWCWRELVKSSPAFLYLLATSLSRSIIMEKLSSMSRQNVKLAWIGFLLIIPAVTLFTSGVLQSLLRATRLSDALEAAHLDLILFNPLVLMGGLFFALALNLAPVFKLTVQDGALVGSIKLRDRLLNLVVISSVAILLTVIISYLLAENFQIFAR